MWPLMLGNQCMWLLMLGNQCMCGVNSLYWHWAVRCWVDRCSRFWESRMGVRLDLKKL